MVSGTVPDLERRKLLLGTPAQPQEPRSPSPFAVIAGTCLALRAISCMTCRDACAPGAIRFALATGGARPSVMAEACTGCAERVLVCPVEAISMAAEPQGEAPGA